MVLREACPVASNGPFTPVRWMFSLLSAACPAGGTVSTTRRFLPVLSTRCPTLCSMFERSSCPRYFSLLLSESNACCSTARWPTLKQPFARHPLFALRPLGSKKTDPMFSLPLFLGSFCVEWLPKRIRSSRQRAIPTKISTGSQGICSSSLSVSPSFAGMITGVLLCSQSQSQIL